MTYNDQADIGYAYYGSYRSGGAYASSASVRTSMLHNSCYGSLEDKDPEWLKEYNDAPFLKSREWPRPSMAVIDGVRVPVLTGDLNGTKNYIDDHIWVYLRDNTYKQVHEGSLYLPTDAEYNKHFRRLFVGEGKVKLISTPYGNRISFARRRKS